MGLLCVCYQFHYQTSIVSNTFDVSEIHNMACDAMSAATTDAEVISRFMNTRYLEKVTNAVMRGDSELQEADTLHTPAQKE
eukprot:15365757-Ditylum_brightwellii.AAC.1